MTLYGIYKTNHNYLLPDVALSCFGFGIFCLYAIIGIIVLFLREFSSSDGAKYNLPPFRRCTRHERIHANAHSVDSAGAGSSGLGSLGKSKNVQVLKTAAAPRNWYSSCLIQHDNYLICGTDTTPFLWSASERIYFMPGHRFVFTISLNNTSLCLPSHWDNGELGSVAPCRKRRRECWPEALKATK